MATSKHKDLNIFILTFTMQQNLTNHETGKYNLITTCANRHCLLANKIEIIEEKITVKLHHRSRTCYANEGYLINGSNGEVAALTIEERIQILRNVRQTVNPKRLLLVNAYSECKCDIFFEIFSIIL
ncbi:hypothetical protein J6590_065962 [Homalodisca vitripennis]|nr:hypothetical protein J6590_065962 [Homalodisca vitripennis]